MQMSVGRSIIAEVCEQIILEYGTDYIGVDAAWIAAAIGQTKFELIT